MAFYSQLEKVFRTMARGINHSMPAERVGVPHLSIRAGQTRTIVTVIILLQGVATILRIINIQLLEVDSIIMLAMLTTAITNSRRSRVDSQILLAVTMQPLAVVNTTAHLAASPLCLAEARMKRPANNRLPEAE